MKRLLVLRHAKTESWGTRPDMERALTPEGEAEARLLLDTLRADAPDLVLCSPATRTRQTWACAGAGLDIRVVVEPRIYEADVPTLLAVLDDHDVPGTVLVVGHNPGVEGLVEHLGDRGVVRMRPGTIVRLHVPGNLAGQGCTVVDVVEPNAGTM